ncbi:hypothetical protein B0A48_12606 [Cryoendolithus antarcticus]|uniref:Uncharacterized protein n=1 Tax=Cryoendolithus antarcticus TaxID=1507870 RepID=A0A1V8SR68_9PEZI|nr:hypothetical protein B0A48_12606 [Cryoendolithus antarcticus]
MALRPDGALRHWEQQARGAWQLRFFPEEREITMDEDALEGITQSIEVEEEEETGFCFVKWEAYSTNDSDRGRAARCEPARRCDLESYDDEISDSGGPSAQKRKRDLLIEEVIATGAANKRRKSKPKPLVCKPRVSFLGVKAISMRKGAVVPVALYDCKGEMFSVGAKIRDVQLRHQWVRVLFDVSMSEEGTVVSCHGKMQRTDSGCEVLLMTNEKMVMNTV